MKVLVTGANGYIGRHVVKALLDKGADVIACDIVTNDVDDRAVRKTLNLFELPEGNVYEQLGFPDVCLHMAWRNGFVHNAPTQIGDLSAHYKFLTAMIDGGLKQLAVMGTMHEVGYWEGAIDENTPCNPLRLAPRFLAKFLFLSQTQRFLQDQLCHHQHTPRCQGLCDKKACECHTSPTIPLVNLLCFLLKLQLSSLSPFLFSSISFLPRKKKCFYFIKEKN